MHAALIRFISISPVLLMKYAKNNIHRRFYIFIILKTEFFRKGGFSQSLVFLYLWKIAIGARFRLCRTEKGRTMCAPTVKKILCRSPFSERLPLSDFHQTKK